MIKRNQRALNIINGATDLLINFGAILLAYVLRFDILTPERGTQPLSAYVDMGLLNAVISVVIYILFGLYAPKRRTGFARDAWIVVRANVINILFLVLIFFIRREMDFSRWLLVFYFLISTVAITLKHTTVRLLLRKLRLAGRNLKHVVLIGSGSLARSYAEAIKKTPQLGYRLAGWILCPGSSECPIDDTPPIGTLSELSQILSSNSFDEAIIALDEGEVAGTKPAIDVCNVNGVRFSVIPYFTEYSFSATAPEVQTINGVQIFDICASPLDSVLNRVWKRCMDFVAALVIAIITSPLMVLSVVLIKLTSRGPVLFKQERVGRKGHVFNMYKFRSMRVNAQQSTAWSTKGDTRVTAWGKFMRKASIDELPQLFNIIKGDMSLVGPRPEIPFHVDHFKVEIPYYMARHQIRPGLTGLAQVNGFRGDTSIENRIQHDLYYIYNWSLALDIRIIFRTILGGIINRQE